MQMPENKGENLTVQFKAVFPEAAKDSKSTLIPLLLLEGRGGVEKLKLRPLTDRRRSSTGPAHGNT